MDQQVRQGPTSGLLISIVMRSRSINYPGLPDSELSKVSSPDIFFSSSLLLLLIFNTRNSLVEFFPLRLFRTFPFLLASSGLHLIKVLLPLRTLSLCLIKRSFSLTKQHGQKHGHTQSSGSVVSGSTQTKSENIFSDRAVAFVLKDATVYQKKNGQVHDPKEHTTVALWEDLYNKVFLMGYSNNSQ